LNQTKLTRELGVSIIPVREALKTLQAEGHIEIIPHRGAFVRELSLEEMEDLYLIRARLEELAAELAVGNLTESRKEHLRHLYEEMEAATERTDHKSLMRLNREFHFTIYSAASRKHLLRILEELWDQSHRFRSIQTTLPNRSEEALKEHKKILDACFQGNKKALGEAVRFNVERTGRVLTRIIYHKGTG
jgi:DNA-binding GntR family transcriptional regulator